MSPSPVCDRRLPAWETSDPRAGAMWLASGLAAVGGGGWRRIGGSLRCVGGQDAASGVAVRLAGGPAPSRDRPPPRHTSCLQLMLPSGASSTPPPAVSLVGGTAPRSATFRHRRGRALPCLLPWVDVDVSHEPHADPNRPTRPPSHDPCHAMSWLTHACQDGAQPVGGDDHLIPIYKEGMSLAAVPRSLVRRTPRTGVAVRCRLRLTLRPRVPHYVGLCRHPA